MYLNRFSSGTILALLALSGILFLVPVAAPVHAASSNSSLPTIKTSPTLVLQETPTAFTETITNPGTNAFPILTVTFIAPSGWNFTSAANNVALVIGNLNAWCSAAATNYGFTGVAVSSTAIECGSATGLPQGFTVTFGSLANQLWLQGPSSPASAAPVTGTFTTSVSDASMNGAYPGPSWTETSIAAHAGVYNANHQNQAPPTIAVTGNVAGYTAGGAAQTVTATLTAPSQIGVPVTFGVGGGYPTAPYTTTFTPASGSTSAAGVVTSSWQPSNHVPDATAPTATITGTGFLGTSLTTTTTAAGAASTVTFYLGVPIFPSTDYVTANAIVNAITYANIPLAGITYAATDAYANAVAAPTSGTLTTANGNFVLAGPTLSTTCNVLTTCGGYQAVPQYVQSLTFGTVGQISASLTGAAYSVAGVSGIISTSLMAADTPAIAATSNGVAVVASAGAGTYVIPQVTFNGAPPVPQAAVPVTISVCPHGTAGCLSTKGYSGTFVTNGLQTITVPTSITSPSTGNASAHFSVDTTLAHVVNFEATVADPVNGNPTQTTAAVMSAGVTTAAGAAAEFKVAVTLTNGPLANNDGPSVSSVVAGGTAYVDVYVADKYGNVITVPANSNGLAQQTFIGLSATAGALSTPSAYIPAGCGETNGTSLNGCILGSNGFGTLSWTVSSVVGTLATLTVTGVLGGVSTSATATVTSVSPNPTISVTSPAPKTVAGSSVIPSQVQAVIFQGKAAASTGYPSSVTVSGITYKIGTGSAQSVAITAGNSILWSAAATLPVGVSTIAFTATDSNGNTGSTPTYTVLVDSVAPTFAFSSATSTTGSLTVTVTSAEGDFNESTFAATWNGAAVPSSSIAWSGTQVLGTGGSVTATLSGLITGTGTLAVSGNSYTAVSGSNSETLTVTIPFSGSITFTTGSATWGQSGSASGIFVPVTNSWNTAQQLTIYATLKSGTSTYVLVGGETLAAGQTGTVFLQDFLTSVPVGAYTVTFSALTTANAAVSNPTTPITLTT